MTLFIAYAAALLALTAGLLTRAAWRRRGAPREDGSARAVETLKEQLRQLAALRDAGALTPEQHESGKAALERKLLDQITAPPAAPATPAADPATPSRRLVVGIVAFLAVVAGGGYWLIGTPDSVSTGPGSLVASADAGADGNAPVAPHGTDSAQIEGMVDQLAERLKSHPDDAESWAMLARSQVALGRYAPALESFSRAVALRPADANLLADQADALAMTRQRNLQGEPAALIQRALQIDPNNVKALALAGTLAFDRKDYAEAVRQWETLERFAPPDSPIAVQVRSGIDEARRLAGMPPAPAPAPAPAPEAGTTATAPGTTPVADRMPAPAAAPAPGVAKADAKGATPPGGGEISGTLTLAPALQGRVSPDDSVFIYARAVEGPRMPLAVMRKQVKDLPMQFTLDDRMAMSPQLTLSSSRQVVLTARVSRSGNAIAKAGDLQGSTGPVAVGATGLRLEINQEVSGDGSSAPPAASKR